MVLAVDEKVIEIEQELAATFLQYRQQEIELTAVRFGKAAIESGIFQNQRLSEKILHAPDTLDGPAQALLVEGDGKQIVEIALSVLTIRQVLAVDDRTMPAQKVNDLRTGLIDLAKTYDAVFVDLGAGVDRAVRQMAGPAATSFIVITDDFELQRVWARGQQMVEDGQAIVKGTFEA